MQKSLNISTFGAKHELGQLNRINDGFKCLGHIVDEDKVPDLIYANDPGGYKEAIELKQKFRSAKLILDVQDVPLHVKEINEWIRQRGIDFYFADKVCTISKTTKEDVLRIFPQLQIKGVDVIYQPIKPVSNLNLKRDNRLMSVGRMSDPNKNFSLILQTIPFLGLGLDIYGSDNVLNGIPCYYGKVISYKGIVSDEDLNIAYNTHIAGIMCSNREGICLPIIESIVAGMFPIVTSNLQTAREFVPHEFICNPNSYDIINKLNYIINNKDKYIPILDEYGEKYSKMFSPVSVANNILDSFYGLK